VTRNHVCARASVGNDIEIRHRGAWRGDARGRLSRQPGCREQRRDVTVGAHAQHQQVEGLGRGAEQVRVGLCGRVHVVPELPVAGWHRVHAVRAHRHGVEEVLARLRLVTLRVTSRYEPLIAPPEVDA
jgi:hypothetical protein